VLDTPVNTDRRCAPVNVLIVFGLMLLVAGCNMLESGESDQPADAALADENVSDTSRNTPPSEASQEPGDVPRQVPDEAYEILPGDDGVAPTTPVRVVEGSLQEPRTLNPVLVDDPLSDELSGLVFSGLTRIDPDTGEPEPDLASGWDISDNRTRYTFEIREGVSWHDGQPFTAQDVQFTFALMMDERTRSPRYSRVVERIAGVEALGPQTVEIRLLAPYAPFLSTIATFGIVPQHVLSNVLPDELAADPFGASSAIGTGPFVLSRWERGERIVFDAYRGHHAITQGLDQYEFRIVADESGIFDGLEDGSIDWARVSPALFADVDTVSPADARSIPSFEMISVILQLDSGKTTVFESRTIRQALLIALDRESMVEEIWNEHAEVAHSVIPSSSWAAQSPETQYQFNRARAGELLDEAGWFIGDSGVREQNGETLGFSLIANGESGIRRELAEWLAEQWRAIGVDVSIEYETRGSIRDRVTITRDFESMLLGYRWDVDPDQHAMWSSDSIPDAFNLGSYMNPDVDRLLDEALSSADPETRRQIYEATQELVLQDLPVLPLAYPNQLIAMGPRLHHIEQTAILLRNRSNVAEWVPVDAETDEDVEVD
jgi:peptide/nickel transport system substrate-binding protein